MQGKYFFRKSIRPESGKEIKSLKDKTLRPTMNYVFGFKITQTER